MMQALRGEPLTVYGDGQQTRSFCYVSDLIEGILRLSRSDEHLPVNIGNPVEFTILECAEAILEVTESSSLLRFRAVARGRSDAAANRISRRQSDSRLGAEKEISPARRAQAFTRFLPVQSLKTGRTWE